MSGTPVYRGSRKHVLDWTERPSFLTELAELLEPAAVSLTPPRVFMPQGRANPREARLEYFGPEVMPGHSAWRTLQDWWLIHKGGANTPNWDIACTCEIEDVPGLVLVEAKANWPELGLAGKTLGSRASLRSRENHEHIGRAIEEACRGWRGLDGRCAIARDTHYQFANRLAFTWKLAALGIPVVLVYMGFTGDTGIYDAGAPFTDDEDWRRGFSAYSAPVMPREVMERRIEFAGVPVWFLSRSRPVLEVSLPVLD
jgi:hypothetical protein